MDMDVSPQFDGYSGVEVVVDENTSYFAGNTNGRVLTIQNQWGTQEQADNILASIRGFQYQPFKASGALLNPAAEIGDGVSLHGLYSGLYKISRNYSSLMATDIEAPEDEEIDHEYPFESKGNREITRKFTAVESELILQSNEIAARVTQTGGDNSSFGWSLVSDHFSLFSGSTEVFRVDSSGAQVTGVITATSGKIGNFNIGNVAIWNNIPDFSNSGGLTSGVYVGTDGIRLGQKFTVDTAGNATATRLTVDTLVIGGTAVSAETLNNRANHAYTSTTSGGYCYKGSGYGYNYNSALARNASGSPSWFSAYNLQARSQFFLGNTSLSLKTASVMNSVGGTMTITYLGTG